MNQEFNEKYYEGKVGDLLRKLGIPVNSKGYKLLKISIIKQIEDNNELTSITKSLYPTVSQETNIKVKSIESGIRYAIQKAYKRGNESLYQDIFGYSKTTCSKQPTNTEFIACVTEIITKEYTYD